MGFLGLGSSDMGDISLFRQHFSCGGKTLRLDPPVQTATNGARSNHGTRLERHRMGHCFWKRGKTKEDRSSWICVAVRCMICPFSRSRYPFNLFNSPSQIVDPFYALIGLSASRPSSPITLRTMYFTLYLTPIRYVRN